MVGLDCRGAIGVGAARDCGFDIGEINLPSGDVRPYVMNMVTAGLQLGGALDVVWTTLDADALELNLFRGEVVEYDFFLGGVSAHAGAGFTFQVVFDRNWKAVGTRGGPGIGADMGLFFGVVGFN